MSAAPPRRALRALDAVTMLVFAALMLALTLRLRPWFAAHPELLVAVAIVSCAAADLVSGLFHWIGDTWGTPTTPIAGKLFICPFREHHVDQLAITRHGFLEVNGATCLISVPVALLAHTLPLDRAATGPGLMSAFLGTFLGWIFATNQFHKWAHIDQPPWLARHLQRWHVILPAEHHRLHHTGRHDSYYCITTGWLNAPLQRLRFFTGLERLVTNLTGVQPQHEDRHAREIVVRDGALLCAALPR